MEAPKVFDEVVSPREALFALSYAPWPGTINVLWIVLRIVMSTNIRLPAEAFLCNPFLILAVGVRTIHAVLGAFGQGPATVLDAIAE